MPGELARWNRAGGRIMAGLIARRTAETALWRTPDAGITAPDAPATIGV